MKALTMFLTLVLWVSGALAAVDEQVLEFKAKVGFTKGEDTIAFHEFFDDERKILIIGEKSIQIWDTATGKPLVSAAHQISQFAPRGFVSSYLLLGVPKLLQWRPVLVDESGRWLITVEKVGTNVFRSAVVRDLQSLKQIAILDLPNVSTEYVAFDPNRDEILTQGETGKTSAFADWNADNFARQKLISIDEYKWHQLIDGENKMIVGSGDTKFLWKGANIKGGNHLTLRDVKTGAVEKQYTAANLKPKSAFQETTVSDDEKYLISKRDDRIFVWEIAGGGQPKFEISNPNPKGGLKLKEIVGKRFIVVKIDEQLLVYDTEENGAPKIAAASPNPKEGISFKEIVDRRFVVAKVDEQLRVYDLKGNGQSFFELAPSTPNEGISLKKIVNDRLVVVKVDKKLRVYDAPTKTLKIEIVAGNADDSVEYRGVTEDGRYLVVYDDRKVSVFDLDDPLKPLYEIARDSEKERFPTVQFVESRKLLAIARVNKSAKKEPRTEFYEMTTGKLVFDASFEAEYGVKFSPDGDLIYQTKLGSFEVWNVPARKFYSLRLASYSPPSRDTNDPSYHLYTDESPYNTEFAAFSPDYRYVLRYDGDVASVFDAATGARLQTIFDADRVKYNKQNQIKSSGLDEAGWINQGRYVYAFDSGGVFSSGKTVSFWEVKK